MCLGRMAAKEARVRHGTTKYPKHLIRMIASGDGAKLAVWRALWVADYILRAWPVVNGFLVLPIVEPLGGTMSKV